MEKNLLERIQLLKSSGNDLLAGIILDDDSCNVIAEYVKENDIFIKFEASNGSITSKGLSYLSSYISHSKTITKVSFEINNIGDNDLEEDIQTFCYSLIINKSIQHLDLSYNKLGNKYATHLSKLFKENHILKTINLRNNNFNDEDGKLFLESIAENQNLIVLDLFGNNINTEIIENIDKLLHKEVLEFRENSFQSYKIDEISKTIEEIVKSEINFDQANILLDNNDLKNKYDQLCIEFQTLEDKNKNQANLIDQQKAEIEMLKASPKLICDHQSLIEEKASLEEEVLNLKSELEKNESRTNQMILDQKKAFESTINNLEASIKSKDKELERVKNSNLEYAKTISDLKSMMEDISKEKDNVLQSYKEKFEEKINDYNNEKVKLMENIHELEDQCKNFENIKDQIKLHNENNISKLKNATEVQNTKFQKHFEFIEENYSKFFKNLQEEIDYYKSQLEKYSTLKSEIDIQINEKKLLLIEISKIKTDMEGLGMENENFRQILIQKERNQQQDSQRVVTEKISYVISPEYLNQIEELRMILGQCEFELQNALNNAAFYEDEYAKLKAYLEVHRERMTTQAISFHSPPVIPPPYEEKHIEMPIPIIQMPSPKIVRRIPPRIKEEFFIPKMNFPPLHPVVSKINNQFTEEYEFRPVRTYVKKTIVVPNQSYQSTPERMYRTSQIIDSQRKIIDEEKKS